MPKINKEGKYVISAGEVGSYIVCPESWRLEKVEKYEPPKAAAMLTGAKEHKSWEHDLDEAKMLTWASKVIFFLIILVIAIYVFYLAL